MQDYMKRTGIRKLLLIILGVGAAVAVLFAVKFVLRLTGNKIGSGRYHAVDCGMYPDAYIEVDGTGIRFGNIDLNALYRKNQLENILKIQHDEDIAFDTGFSDEELEEMSDLNKMFVENTFEYDPDLATKDGTYTKLYRCYCDGNLFGLYLKYDAWNRTITITNQQAVIEFRKE